MTPLAVYDRGPGRFYARARVHDGFLLTVGAAPSSSIIRENVGSSFLTYSTPASTLLEPDVAGSIREFDKFQSGSDLVQGTNVITAIVYKATEGDSFSFDLDLDYERDYPSGDAVAGNEILLILREDGVSFTSPDGLSWTRHDDTALVGANAEEIHLDSLTWINGEFMFRSKDGQKVFRSPDGIDWDVDQVAWTGTVWIPSFFRRLENLQWDGSQYYSYAPIYNGNLATSPDAVHWHIREIKENFSNDVLPRHIIKHEPGLMAFGGNRAVRIDSLNDIDGDTFGPPRGSSGVIRKFRVLENDLIAYDQNNIVYQSTDGIDFRQVTGSHFRWDIGFTDNLYYRFAFNSDLSTLTRFEAIDLPDYDLFNSPWAGRSEIVWPLTVSPNSYLSTETLHVAVGDRLEIATSANGIDWVDRSPDTQRGGWFNTVEQLPEGGFVAFGTSGAIFKSDDGIVWEDISIPDQVEVTNVAQLGGVFVASVFRHGNSNYGDPSQVFVYTDGSWSSQVLADYGPIRGVASGQGIFKAIADSHMFTSVNGIDWQASTLRGGGARAIAFFKDNFIIGRRSGFRHFGATRETTLEPLAVVSAADGQSLHTNDPVEISLDFGDSDIVSVKYFVNSKLVGEQSSGPFFFRTLAGTPGDYRLSYLATDASGAEARGAIRYSTEMEPWQTVAPDEWQNFHQVAELPGDRLVAVGSASDIGSSAVVFEHGKWVPAAFGNDINFSNLHKLVVAEELDTIVALQPGLSSTFAVSRGGNFWVDRSVSLPSLERNLNHGAYGNGLFLLMAAGSPSRIVVSSDGFEWSVIPNDGPFFPANLRDLTFFNGHFLALTAEAELYASTDGQNWILKQKFGPAEVTSSLRFETLSDRLIVALGPNDPVESFEYDYWFTEDASTWTGGAAPGASPMASIACNDGAYSAIFGSKVFESENLLNWAEPLADLTDYDPELTSPTLLHHDGMWRVFSIHSRSYLQSADLNDWSVSADFVATSGTHDIATDGESMLAAGMAGWLAHSTDGIDWTRQAPFTTENIVSLDYFAGQWVGIDASGTVYHSTDREEWVEVVAPFGAHSVVHTIEFNNRLVAITLGAIFASEDGVEWHVKETLDETFSRFNPARSVIVNDHLVVFANKVGSDEVFIWSSANGEDWQRSSDSTPLDWAATYHIIFDGSDYRLARTSSGTSLGNSHFSSKDLVTWTFSKSPIPIVYTPFVASGPVSLSRQGTGVGLRISLDQQQTWATIPSSNLSDIIYAPHLDAFVGISPIGQIRMFPLADIAATRAQWPEAGERGLGDTIDFEWTLENAGLKLIDRPVSMRARYWLSETEQLGNGRRYLMGERIWEGTLLPGDKKVFSETSTITGNIALGSYYVIVSIDSNYPDLSDHNNELATSEPIIGIAAHALYADIAGEGDLFLMGGDSSVLASEGARRVFSGEAFSRGTEISLYAQPKQGYAFTGWENHPSGGDSVLRVVMNEDQYVSPIFTPLHTINVIQAEGGVIHIDTLETDVLEGTRLRVQAVPDQGKRFLRWTGALDGVAPDFSFDLEGDLEFSAEFVDGIEFAEWAENRWGTGNTIDPQVDSSGNGWPNTLEFFLGMESETSHPPIYEIKNSEDFFTLRFQYDRAAIVGAFVVEASTDLTTWSEASVETLYSEGPGMSAIVEALVSKEGPKKFLRLKVVLPD